MTHSFRRARDIHCRANHVHVIIQEAVFDECLDETDERHKSRLSSRERGSATSGAGEEDGHYCSAESQTQSRLTNG